MGRMRLVPQGVQKKNVQTFQLMKRRLGNLAVIGEIGRSSKAEAIDLRLAMYQPHRFEVRPEKFHCSINRLQLQLWQTAIFVVSVKDVTEHFPQECGRHEVGCKKRRPRA